MNEDLKHKIGLVVVIASLLGVCAMPMGMAVSPAPPAVIQCSVTATTALISVSVDPDSTDYGEIWTGESNSSGNINATNTGNVAENFTIKGIDATGAGYWVLADTIGTDQYRHTFNASSETNLNLTPKPLATSIPVNDNKTFFLTLYTPSEISATGIYTFRVIVVASEA